MSTHDERQSGCGGILAAVLLVLLLGLFVLGLAGSFFLYAWRSQSAEGMARAQAELAMQQARLAELRAEQNRLVAETQPEAVTVDMRIAVDPEGVISVDDQLTPWEELGGKLRGYAHEHGGQLSLVMEVDPQCKFEHVARILELCAEVGVEPRFATGR